MIFFSNVVYGLKLRHYLFLNRFQLFLVYEKVLMKLMVRCIGVCNLKYRMACNKPIIRIHANHQRACEQVMLVPSIFLALLDY